MRTTKKRLLSALLTLCMVLTLLPMTALPVYAASPATPTNLTWGGNIAKWDGVGDATGYRVILKASEDPDKPTHNMIDISNENLSASEISRDYSDLLLPGMTYLFSVRTLKGEEYSGFAVSDKQTIPGSIDTIAVTWGTGEDSKKASWSSVSGATGYSVRVRKDGVQSGGVIKISATEIDLTETVNTVGSGPYSVEVRAYKSEAGNWMAIGKSEDKALQANAVATVADVTINGQQGSAVASQDVTITLTNDTFVSPLSGSWITNLPAGLIQTLTRSSDTEAKITISGTPTAASSEVLEITIPAASLNGGKKTTVKSNTNAKFNIMANTTIIR